MAAPLLGLPRAPDFAATATRVLDLYARVVQGQGLGSGEDVISADEKPSIQARCRCHPTRTRVMRVEHEDDHGGALASLAAGTSTGRGCSAAASPPLGSSRSDASSPRS